MPPKKNKSVEKRQSAESDSDIPDRLVCPVCMEVPKKVMLTNNCGHLFCEECINKVLQQRNAACPVCKKSISKENVSHSLFTQREINALPIQCPSDGCTWKAARSELAAHLAVCPLAVIQCRHRCGESGTRQQMQDHAVSCPEALMRCPNGGCEQSFRRKGIEIHRRRCPYEIVRCKGCSEETTRQDSVVHQLEACPESIVDCPHAEDGCKAKMKRKLMDEHLEANKLEHLQLQMTAMRKTHQAEIDQLHDKLETTNKKLLELLSTERRMVRIALQATGTVLSESFTLFGRPWQLKTAGRGPGNIIRITLHCRRPAEGFGCFKSWQFRGAHKLRLVSLPGRGRDITKVNTICPRFNEFLIRKKIKFIR